MSLSRHLAILLALALWSVSGTAGELGQRAPTPLPSEAGLPILVNFSPQEMGGHPQNWAFLQDAQGILLVGNGSGILEYDGSIWRMIPTPRGSGIRALAMAPDGRIFAASTGEFGQIEADAAGTRRFVSLAPLLQPRDYRFDAIRTIHPTRDAVLFVGKTCILEYRGSQVHVHRLPESVGHSFLVGETLYLQKASGRLVTWEQGREKPVPGSQSLEHESLCFLLPDSSTGALLAGTQAHGLFWLGEKGIHPFATEADALLHRFPLTAGIRLRDGSLALATSGAGVLVLDARGRLRQVVDKDAGLRDSAVISLFQGQHGSLWLGMNNGVAHVEQESPLSVHDARSGLPSFPWALARHRSKLHVATGQGTFRLEADGASRKQRFRQLPGVTGISTSLLSLEEGLLIGAKSRGVYLANNAGSRLIWANNSTPFNLFRSPDAPDKVFVSLDTGVAVLQRRGGRWAFAGMLPGVNVNNFRICQLRQRELWISTFAQGLVRATFSNARLDGPPKVQFFGFGAGLPTETTLQAEVISGRLLVATASGFFSFDETSERFQPDPILNSLLGAQPKSLTFLHAGPGGRIWVGSKDTANQSWELGTAEPRPEGGYSWLTGPFKGFSDLSLTDLLSDADGVVWFGTIEGLVRYDPRMPQQDRGLQVLIRRVVGSGNQFYLAGNSSHSKELTLRSTENHLRFEFACPGSYLESSRAFQVRLEGQDEDWSSWAPVPFKEYASLHEGGYRFHVRTRDSQGRVSDEQVFSFRILPPWQRTWWARTLFAMVAISAGFSIAWLRIRFLSRLNRELEARVAEGTQELLALNGRLNRLNEQKTQFLSIAVHDLNNPLNGILLGAGLMERETDPERIVQRARNIQQQGLRMRTILRRFLNVTAIEEGSLSAELSEFPLGEMASQIVHQHFPVAQQKSITLVFDRPAPDLVVRADRGFSEEALSNLLSNALKFSTPGTKVEVRIQCHGNKAELAVADQGPGLTAGDQANLWERFTKLSARPTGGEQSTGLGLSIVKQLVETMGCTIEVESEPGKGATFRIKFPLAGAAAGANS